MNIAITGASGNIGGMVARHLNTRGLPLILPLRNPTKAPALPNCEARRFAYDDLELAKQALNGVEVLFMVSAAESPTREQEHLTLVQAASEAGVQHMVYLSFAQAALDSTFTLARTHAVTENAIRQTNMRYTFLRDNFYSEMMATIANADGIIAGPADDGRVACVSQRDVAQAAANGIADLAGGHHRHETPGDHESVQDTLPRPERWHRRRNAHVCRRQCQRCRDPGMEKARLSCRRWAIQSSAPQ